MATRIEVITSTERRRSYTDADRAAILAKCAEPGAFIAAVARQYETAESLIYDRRSKQRADVALASEPLQFIPCREVAEVHCGRGARHVSPQPPRPQARCVRRPVPNTARSSSSCPSTCGSRWTSTSTGGRWRGCCASLAGRPDPARPRRQDVPGLQARVTCATASTAFARSPARCSTPTRSQGGSSSSEDGGVEPSQTFVRSLYTSAL